MDLLDCGIAYEKVSHAIKSAMHICGLKSRNDVYPKKDYVANCNQSKLSLGHRHTAEICYENEHQHFIVMKQENKEKRLRLLLQQMKTVIRIYLH